MRLDDWCKLFLLIGALGGALAAAQAVVAWADRRTDLIDRWLGIEPLPPPESPPDVRSGCVKVIRRPFDWDRDA